MWSRSRGNRTERAPTPAFPERQRRIAIIVAERNSVTDQCSRYSSRAVRTGASRNPAEIGGRWVMPGRWIFAHRVLTVRVITTARRRDDADRSSTQRIAQAPAPGSYLVLPGRFRSTTGPQVREHCSSRPARRPPGSGPRGRGLHPPVIFRSSQRSRWRPPGAVET